MITSTALKYARALLEAAAENATEDAVLTDLRSFDSLLSGHDELRSTLQNPVVPFPSKRKIVEALGVRIPFSQTVQNFILIAVSNARIHQFSSLVDAFSQVLDEKREIQQGTVYSANALDSAQRELITQGMTRLTKGHVRLAFEEDSDLIGGIKIRLGSTIFDGSIRARLNELEKRLAR